MSNEILFCRGEVEGVQKVVRRSVSARERGEGPSLLYKLENRDRLIAGAIDESFFRERRDDERGDARARAPAVDDRRGHMIPSSAVFVIGNDDGARGPRAAFLDRPYQIGAPVESV